MFTALLFFTLFLRYEPFASGTSPLLTRQSKLTKGTVLAVMRTIPLRHTNPAKYSISLVTTTDTVLSPDQTRTQVSLSAQVIASSELLPVDSKYRVSYVEFTDFR